MTAFIKTDDHITIVFDDGENITIYENNPNYKEIVKAINDEKWEKVRRLATPRTIIEEEFQQSPDSDRIKLGDGIVYVDDQPLHTSLTKRIVDMVREGINVSHMIKFLENLMDNPSYRAVQELYTFLEKSNLPITNDGHFLAYKRITTDWKDEYTGKIDNSIGSIVEVPRNMVDEDSSRTCSKGLHFCSKDYLPHYGSSNGGRIVIVKINPRDVVAIPNDYNHAKGRCCRYQVINEIKLESSNHNALPKTELKDLFVDLEPKANIRVLAQCDQESGDIIATFNSIANAAVTTGIDSSGISKAARGIRKTAGGYTWKWIDSNPTPPSKTKTNDELIAITIEEEELFNPLDDEEMW